VWNFISLKPFVVFGRPVILGISLLIKSGWNGVLLFAPSDALQAKEERGGDLIAYHCLPRFGGGLLRTL